MFKSIQKKLVFSFVLISTISVLLSSGYLFYIDKHHFIDEIKKQSHDNLVMISGEIKSQFDWITKDIFFLRDMLCLSRYCNSANPINPVMLEDSLVKSNFSNLAVNHQIYIQIRYLDETGMEIIRVDYEDGKAVVIPDDQLQNKRHRYYFKETINLDEEQVYISPMDLNIEHGVIEIPQVPTMRFATPVFDSQKKKKGILILNIKADLIYSILEQDRSNFLAEDHQYFLINNKGYFLFHPEKKYRFGFMSQDGITMDKVMPVLGKVANFKNKDLNPATRFQENDKFLYTWHEVFFPGRDLKNIAYGISSTQQKGMHYTDLAPNKLQWMLISSTDIHAILSNFDRNLTKLFIISCLILLICLSVAVLTGLSLAKPVIRLSRAVKKIQDGDLSFRARITTKDEIGELGGTINKMAARLGETLHQCQLSEEKYRRIFENSKDSLFVTDNNGQFTEVNLSFKTMMGYNDPNKLENGSLQDLFVDRQSYDDFIKSISTFGFVKNYHIPLISMKDKKLICLITASIIFEVDLTIKGYEGVIRDITKRMKDIKKKRQFKTLLNEEIILSEDKERRLLGQVLHDEIAQDLALAKLKVQDAETFVQKKEQKILLSESDAILSSIISKIRNIMYALYPVILGVKGIVDSMKWYNAQFSEKTGIPILFTTKVKRLDLKKSHQIYLFRTYKELLNNCFKHSDTTEIVVTLRKIANSIILVVNDDGKGFNAKNIFAVSKGIKGIGLFSIREWADSVGGQFTIESEIDQGTRAILEIKILDTMDL